MSKKFDIATTMNNIISDDSYQKIFAKPSFQKLAAKKEEEEEKADKKEEKGKGKGKEEECKCEKGKGKGKKMSQYQTCVLTLAKVSELLDKAGYDKASIFTVLALDSLVKSASASADDQGMNDCGFASDKKDDDKKEDDKEEDKKDDDKKDDKEEDKKEDKDDDKKEEDDKNDAPPIDPFGDWAKTVDLGPALFEEVAPGVGEIRPTPKTDPNDPLWGVLEEAPLMPSSEGDMSSAKDDGDDKDLKDVSLEELLEDIGDFEDEEDEGDDDEVFASSNELTSFQKLAQELKRTAKGDSKKK